MPTEYEILASLTTEQLVDHLIKVIKKPMMDCIEFVIEERMKVCLIEIFKNLKFDECCDHPQNPSEQQTHNCDES
jgi:hypothetical protein